MTERSQRMIDSAPDYYQEGGLYHKHQEAIAAELDQVATDEEDLRLQRRIKTATWGLSYWEDILDIPTVTGDSYASRRSRVLSRWRSVGNLSAELIRSVAESYSGGEVEVTIDIPGQVVHIKFVGSLGIPTNLDDLKTLIDNIIHAHLGVEYSFTYITFGDLGSSGKTFGDIGTAGVTFGELATWDEV